MLFLLSELPLTLWTSVTVSRNDWNWCIFICICRRQLTDKNIRPEEKGKKDTTQTNYFHSREVVFCFEITMETKLLHTTFWVAVSKGEQRVFCLCQMSRLGLGNCYRSITERLKSAAIDQQRGELCLPTSLNTTHEFILCRREIGESAVVVESAESGSISRNIKN